MNQQIDWSGIRANSVTMGIRASARQAATNLPLIEQKRFVNRVLKRAEREGWQKAKQAAIALVPPSTQGPAKPLSANVVNGAMAMENIMSGRKEKSRFHLSQFVLNASKVASRSRSPLKDAQNVRHVAAVHSAIWPEQQITPGVTLNLLNVAGGMQ